MTFTSTLTLQPGDIILDYATHRPTAADFAAIAAQHGRPVRAVVRYQAAKTSIPEKLLYQPETKFLHDLGIGIIICHESYATRAATGYAGGIADGKYMQWWAEGVSYPTDVPIVAADDTNETAPTLPTAGLYQAGFDLVTASPTGPYGDNDIMQWCVDHNYGTGILWYAGARAWSNYKPPIARCHVQQLVVGSVAGKYDMNVVLQPINCWLPHEQDPIPTTPLGSDMTTIITNAESHLLGSAGYGPKIIKWAIMPDGSKRHIEPYEWYAYGSPEGSLVSSADLDKWPDYQPAGQVTATVDPAAIRAALSGMHLLGALGTPIINGTLS